MKVLSTDNSKSDNNVPCSYVAGTLKNNVVERKYLVGLVSRCYKNQAELFATLKGLECLVNISTRPADNPINTDSEVYRKCIFNVKTKHILAEQYEKQLVD